MFSAMCECQALHPDPEDEDSDNDFEGEEYDLEGAGMGKTFQHTPNITHTNIHATHITSTVQICFVCMELTYRVVNLYQPPGQLLIVNVELFETNKYSV